MRLSEIVIRNLKAPDRGARLYHDDLVPGFAVRVSQAGTKAFCLTYGKTRSRVTIGRYPTISLANARAEARRILAERTLGKHRPKAMAFDKALETFLSTHYALKNRPKTVRETERLLRKHFASLKGSNLADITTHDITAVTDRLAVKGLESTAGHALVAVNTFFRWCVRRRYIPHNPIEGLEPPGKHMSRERVLADAELAKVMDAAGNAGTYGRLVLLLILTGQRRGEIAGLDASWIDRRLRTVSFPRRITKNHRDHTFPFGAAASRVIAQLPETGLLFPARDKPDRPFSGFSKAKRMLDEQCKIDPWTLHDLRRTFATNLQRLGVRTEVIEALLNHVSGTRAGIVGVYQKHRWWDEMVDAVSRYEEWLRAEIAKPSGDLPLTRVL